MRKIYITFVIIGIAISGYGQNIKYKNIYALLEAGNYESALPQLTDYLEYYPDDGSANLYMGVIAQEYEKNCAKAKEYFEKGLSVIDQKVIDKNEKYYGLWNRRNLRNGKYEVNIDTIRLDTEERIAECDG